MMFEFNTAVPAWLPGLTGIMLQKGIIGCKWSKHFISGGRYWSTLWLAGGMTASMFSVGDDVGDGWKTPEK